MTYWDGDEWVEGEDPNDPDAWFAEIVNEKPQQSAEDRALKRQILSNFDQHRREQEAAEADERVKLREENAQLRQRVKAIDLEEAVRRGEPGAAQKKLGGIMDDIFKRGLDDIHRKEHWAE